MQELLLADDLFELAKTRAKQITIRRGERYIKLGTLRLRPTSGKDEYLDVEVTSIEIFKDFYEIPLLYIFADGAESHNEMFEEMLRFYPDLNCKEKFTVIRWD